MTYYIGNMPVGEDELTHYGIKGMRWGQRRFQNRDGSLTAAGRLKYGYGQARQRTSNWYKKNKKTIGRVAKVAGGVALAGAAGYLGYRNRAALRAAGRAFRAGAKKSSSYFKNRMTGKIFPAGTKRAQFRSKVKFQGAGQVFRDSKAGQNFAKAQRKIRNARMTVGGTVRSAKNVAGEAFRNSKAGQGFAKAGRKVRNAGMTAKGTVTSGMKIVGGTVKRKAQPYVNRVKNEAGYRAAKVKNTIENANFQRKYRNAAKRAAKNAKNAGSERFNNIRARAKTVRYKKAADRVRNAANFNPNIKALPKHKKTASDYFKGVKSAAGKAKSAAGRAAGKAKSTAKNAGRRYNDFMNSNSRLGRSSGVYYSRRRFARDFGKGAAIGAAPYAVGMAGQRVYDRYGKNDKLKSDRWRKKNGYKTDRFGNKYRTKKRK